MCTVIDGQALAAQVEQQLAKEIKREGLDPGLAVILVGNRTDSATYVSMKRKACARTGIRDILCTFPEDAFQEEIESAVLAMNADASVHGILVQLPLPKHIDAQRVLNLVSPDKDVDGLHPLNLGKLVSGSPGLLPCTPKGCIELIKSTGVSIAGKNAVVLGRSTIVGKPAALLLLAENASVTICHSQTEEIERVCSQADIVIAAIGKPEIVKASWIKPGSIVIDVGINAVDDLSKKKGYRLTGDVDFEDVRKVAGFLTPVPKGVGPMTIAMLLKNTVQSARAHQERRN
jgi:5,10-methylene-tetrahydrofolate dehydrogenase/methenyl tetrahydrofolate cyclohydrolase